MSSIFSAPELLRKHAHSSVVANSSSAFRSDRLHMTPLANGLWGDRLSLKSSVDGSERGLASDAKRVKACMDIATHIHTSMNGASLFERPFSLLLSTGHWDVLNSLSLCQLYCERDNVHDAQGRTARNERGDVLEPKDVLFSNSKSCESALRVCCVAPAACTHRPQNDSRTRKQTDV